MHPYLSEYLLSLVPVSVRGVFQYLRWGYSSLQKEAFEILRQVIGGFSCRERGAFHTNMYVYLLVFETYHTPITSGEGLKLIRISPIIHSNAFLSLKAIDKQGRCGLGVCKYLTHFNPFVQGRLRYLGLGCQVFLRFSKKSQFKNNVFLRCLWLTNDVFERYIQPVWSVQTKYIK